MTSTIDWVLRRWAGDVNGDGYADVIVGAPTAPSIFQPTNPGSVGVFSGFNGEPLQIFIGNPSLDDGFGHSVSGAGDVNGDGYADVIVGSPFEPPLVPGPFFGRARVYSGADSTILHVIDGDATFTNAGNVVSEAGDVDNDGKGDFIVASLGRARVFSGATGVMLHQFPAGAPGVGVNAAPAGDVNGDGFDDVLVSDVLGQVAPSFHPGALHVHSGADGSILASFGNPVATPAFASRFGQGGIAALGDCDGDGITDFAAANETDEMVFVFLSASAAPVALADPTLVPPAASVGFGSALDRAGDVDGDGIQDLLVGVRGTQGVPGLLLPVPGKVLVFSGATLTVIQTLNAEAPADEFGFAAARAGDANGNGRDDVIVGAPFAVNGSGIGRAQVFLTPSPNIPAVFSYNSQFFFGTSLFAGWIPDAGDVNALTGTLTCSFATPGALGLYGASLAPTDFQLPFGFPLLIADDPLNFLESGIFGFDGFGQLHAPGITRSNPVLAGFGLHLQFFETSPFIKGSNGLRLQLVP